MREIKPRWQKGILDNQKPIRRRPDTLTTAGKVFFWVTMALTIAYFGWHFYQWSQRDFRVHGLHDEPARQVEIEPDQKWGVPKSKKEAQ